MRCTLVIAYLCLAVAGCASSAPVEPSGDAAKDAQAAKHHAKCAKLGLEPGTKKYRTCRDQLERYQRMTEDRR